MGGQNSKSSIISYEEAVKRISEFELRRIKEAFRKVTGSNSSFLSKNAFVDEVLCDNTPEKLADWIFFACGGTSSKGINFKDLLSALVLLTKGNVDEKIRFLFTLYSNESNHLIVKNDFFKILQNEITYQHNREKSLQNEAYITANTLSLFGSSLTSVTFEQFRSWILMHKDATIFSKWLLLDSSINLTSNNEAPTFYQSLAGVTHLEEKDICDLEKRFWQLKSISLNGQLDLELLTQLLSPLFPISAITGLFAAFDENCDGHIDFKELCCGISQSNRSPDVERIKFCFKVFDLDRDNVLNCTELEHMIQVSLSITYNSRTNISKNLTLDKVLSDLKDFVENNGKLCNVDKNDSTRDSKLLAICQEDFLMWCVKSEIKITQPLTDLLFEICHVIFGLRPQCKHLELYIVKGWLSREKQHGYEIGQFWYLVSSDWWQKWLLFTTCPNNSTSSCLHCKCIGTKTIDFEYESWNTFSAITEPFNNITDIGDSLSLSSASSSTSINRGSPGMIDNNSLLMTNPYKLVPSLTGEGGKLKKEIPLVQHRDFELLPEKLYKALKSWYESTLDLPRQVIKPSSTEELEIELYPLSLRIFRHQQSQQVSTQNPSNHVNTWNTISNGYGALTSSGYSSIASSSSTTNSTPKKYLAYLAAFSRLATIKQVTEFLSHRLKLKSDTIRLWHIPQSIEASYILLEDESSSLEDLRINDDDQILLELRNKDLTWPEEIQYLKISQDQTLLQNRRGTVASVQSFYGLGVCGLHNLGNTCFMNAALQVLFNTKPLTEYFKQNLHLFELNVYNKMSTKGQLTLRYAELLKEILGAQTRSIAPIKFRFSVSKFAPHFTNGMQHDSQELLAWLLDTLHEDLNRVTEKPYIEIKDSNGRSDQIVAKEAYDAFLKRNNSIIVDLFYGQMKSKVTCLTCSTESVRFEPFSLLSLPLPLENFVLCEVLITKLDGEFPTKYAVKLNSDCKYWDLKNHLSLLCNLDPHLILICQVDSSQIKYVFSDDQKINSTTSLNLYGYEIPKLQELENFISTVDENIIKSLKDIQRTKENGSKINGFLADNITIPQDQQEMVKHSIDMLGTSPMSSFMTATNDAYNLNIISNTNNFNNAEKQTVLLNEQMNNNAISKNSYENEEDSLSPSSFRDKRNEHLKFNDFKCNYLIALHRKFLRQETYFLSYHKTKPSLFGVPLLVPFNNDMKNRDLYLNVWTQVSKFLSPLPKASREQSNHAEDCDDSMGYDFPFMLSIVNENGLVCALCPWEKFCRGCNITCNDLQLIEEIQHFSEACSPSSNIIENKNNLQSVLIKKLIYIAIDWDTSALHLRYQSTREKMSNEHESISINRKLLSEPVDLNHCLKAFTTEEKLDENIHCSQCKSKQPATKKLQLWKLPPILIIHLKRFNFVNNKWVKSQKVVNFPLENFDPTLFLASVPQETIFRHRELLELKAKNIKNFDCNQEIKEFDIENDIPVADKTECDKIKNFHTIEINEGANQLNTSRDTNRGKPTRQRLISTSLTKTPIDYTNLIDHNNHKLTENGDPFDLKYKLYAVISHSGMLSGGHYIAYASNTSNKSWYCYNDSSCREISSNSPNIDPSSAYLLFYERKDLDYLPYLPKIDNKEPLLNNHSELLEETDNDLKKMCVLS